MVNKWLIVEWIIRQKARLNEGGQWLSTDLLVVAASASVIAREWSPILIFFPLRYLVGWFMIRYGVSAREAALLRNMKDPQMEKLVNGNS